MLNDSELADALEACPIGVAVLATEDARRLFVNSALVRMFAAPSRQEMLENDITSTWRDPDRLREAWSIFLGRRNLVNFQAARLRFDGTVWWALLNSQPIEFEGIPAGIVWHIDITDRVQAEKALADGEKQLRSAVTTLRLYERVVEATGLGVVIADAVEGYPVLFVNHSFEVMTGYSPADVIGYGMRFMGRNAKGIAPGERRRIAQALSKGGTYLGEVLDSRKDGTRFWNRIAISPVYDTEGRLTHYVGLQQDITAEKEAQQTAMHTAKLASLGEMAAGVAHELNQPLNIIRLAVDNARQHIAAGKNNPAYLDEKLARVQSQTERAASIIDHMKIMGRPAREETELLDLREIGNACINLIGEQMKQLGIELNREVPEKPCFIAGNRVQLEQVVLNLLWNAKDAVIANGGKRHILLCIEDTGDYCELHCCDSGGGIPDDIAPRIFEPFFTTKAEHGGTGLGLSVSYGIIRAMGGKIDVSTCEGGACFKLRFKRHDAGGAATPPGSVGLRRGHG